jgi:polysaccharide export outer membrane protein
VKRLFTGFFLGQYAVEISGKEPMKIKSITDRLVGWPIAFSIFAAAILVWVTGCQTTTTDHYNGNAGMPTSMVSSNDIVLREADALKVSFPGAEKLDTTQVIRRDGKITLPIIGEITAAGKTPVGLQKELVELYSKELVSSKDISVAVISASFTVYVNGAVMNPGKVTANHQLTVLEAIMESGGFNYKIAKLNAVKVIRTENGKTHNYTVNLQGVTSGGPVDIFYLQPLDIVFVPTKIVLF